MNLKGGLQSRPPFFTCCPAAAYTPCGEAVQLAYYLLLSRSITHAQRMSASLERMGVNSRIFRPPLGLSDKGCSYALRVNAAHFLAAMKELQASDLLPVRVFYAPGDGAYHEIEPH